MVVELANGKEVISRHTVGTVDFEIGGKPTSAFFRTLPIGLYDGILGMDWLIANHASIHCMRKEAFPFATNQEMKFWFRVKIRNPGHV